MKNEILFFSSPWCGPCRQMKDMLSEEIVSELNIRIIDIAEDIETSIVYEVMNVPTFIKVVEGKEVSRSTGSTTINSLRKL